MNYVNEWNHYFNLKGTISRKNFFILLFINLLLSYIIPFVLLNIFSLLSLLLRDPDPGFNTAFYITFIFSYILYFILLLFTLAAGVRRMNDINKPRYYLFIPLYNIYLLLKNGVQRVEVNLPDNNINDSKNLNQAFITGGGFLFLIVLLSLITYFYQDLDIIDLYGFITIKVNAYLCYMLVILSMPAHLSISLFIILCTKHITNKRIVLANLFSIFICLFLFCFFVYIIK